jgi:hypothetical protein
MADGVKRPRVDGELPPVIGGQTPKNIVPERDLKEPTPAPPRDKK